MSAGGEGFDRSVPPAPGKIRPFEFPSVTSYELSNGLSIRVAPMPDLPVVSASLILEAGESGVDAARAGLAVLTGDALAAGTQRRSGAELAEAVEGLGAGLAAVTGWDSTIVSLACLSERLQAAAALMAEVVQEPSFESTEFDRYRQQRLATIDQRRMDPRSLADDAAAHFIFDDASPYGRPAGGTKASVAELSRQDAQAYAGGHYRAAGAGLVVVGDVEPAAVRDLAEGLLGGESASAPSSPQATDQPRSRVRTIHVVHRPGAVQSEIRLGHVGQARTSPDQIPLTVLNTILGGAFTSRLNLNLRERHGFTYGVRSQFAFRRQAGPFSVSTAVGTDVTADAVREAMSELVAIVENGPSEDEMRAARDYIVGVFPLRLETTSQVASRISDLIVHELPDDYYDTYRDRIAGVSRAMAFEAGRRAIRPDEMAIVVVGDADVIREPLEALDLGPVEVHAVEGLLE